MSPPRSGLRLGFIEPHLERFGGIRRMVEFANRLTARGHDVTFYVPEGRDASCTWMRCDASVATMRGEVDDALDIVVFNHEPQWHLLDRFPNARRRVFYALHYGYLYEKEGSWESLRAPVDLQLANSNWTADQIAAETGSRPTVVLGGVNREIFHPRGGPKRYPILCTGDWREWKGTDTILAAGKRLGVPVRGYASKDLDQPDLGREYDAAQVFAVGSRFEGFCQPGLEALASGVPLVTTDNGGCREYAIDGETALVVPPDDVPAMADALARVLDDDVLAKDLAERGLDLVDREFDWEKRTDLLAEILDGVSAGVSVAPPRPPPPARPELSVVVLAWDNLRLTQLFVESVRRHTDVPYELIVVDNGSQWEAASYASSAGDRTVLNPENLGFARGMNQGLDVASGRYIAFCNNDTVVPPGWAETLLETARAHERAGIVVPAITEARNRSTVRDEAGGEPEVLAPFSAPPAAVVYVMPTDLVRRLGAWSEEYEIASGEDVDLCFTVWVNDLDIVYDPRVLVAHVGKGTASRLRDWQGLWARNRQRFLDKWTGDGAVPRLDECDPERFERNRATARAAAEWMARYFTLRDRPWHAMIRRAVRLDGVRVRVRSEARRAWPAVRRHLPSHVAHRLRRTARRFM
jgi:glycosyltransferase involved in cell wall biosynthesis/GT2 family glycosyltransferase